LRKAVISAEDIIKPTEFDIAKFLNLVYGFVITLKPIPDEKLKSVERVVVKLVKRKKALRKIAKVPSKKNKNKTL
jgi:hypothetical protein